MVGCLEFFCNHSSMQTSFLIQLSFKDAPENLILRWTFVNLTDSLGPDGAKYVLFQCLY